MNADNLKEFFAVLFRKNHFFCDLLISNFYLTKINST